MLTALIAEDELLVRIGIASCVPWAELGIVLLGEAEDGEEAWKLWQDHHPDLLIVDIRMPGMSGTELLQRIRNEDRRCAVIVITNVEADDALEEVRKLGVSEILLKASMNKEDISRAVRNASRTLQTDNSPEPSSAPDADGWQTFLSDNPENKEPPFPVQGITAVRFFPNEFLTPTLKRSLTTLMIHRTGDPEGYEAVSRNDCTLFLWKETEGEAGLAGKLTDTARYIRDHFRIEPGIVHIEDEKPIGQIRQLAEQAETLLRDPRFFDEPLLSLDAGGGFHTERLDALRRDLARILPLCSAESDVKDLKKLLDRYAGSVRKDFDETLAQAAPLLNALGLPAAREGLHRMTERICAKAEETARPEMIRIRPEIRQIMDYNAAHPAEELSLEEASGTVNFQSSYFSRLFKTETGSSYTEYIFRVKMLCAQELLEETDLPVGEIAARCGFSDVSYFSMRFRQFCGMTPREYREGSSEA